MPIEISVAPPSIAYAELVARVPGLLIHASPEWAAFTQMACPQARPVYFLAYKDGQAVGALPAFEMDGPCGKVLNSLPYYGSHGDLIIDPTVERGPVVQALMQALDEYVQKHKIMAFNAVTHPFRNDSAEFSACSRMKRVDDRIGQISTLPAGTAGSLEEPLLQMFSQKTRNLARKGLKSGFTVFRSEKDVDFQNLHEHHAIGMGKINGTIKSIDQLKTLKQLFGDNCHLYVAYADDIFAGGLLTLVYRDWVEYFMPVSVEAYRSKQVISALIVHAMIDYASRGYSYWNWGGTWRSQEGVYHFKKGWGAKDYVYGYYGYALKEAFSGLTRTELLAAYPNFYLFPFSSEET
ncbi:GNAT family N-acetyltransferase [Microvirga alba]|uniref:GNAT family N-acetyltransferase n=1 Tax=Microvirga alba TaxID=2791025 RepID=A0A931FQP2_9HYPH|nr:GNAT family N-acetyltransferase [Microvirga alba]MBF9231981.1 GNAT family N-acetyltransferase [Microvirga alba]